MILLPSISKLIKEQLKEILAEKYYKEICDEIDNKIIINHDCTYEKYSLNLKCKNFENQSITYGYDIDISSDKKMESKIFKISAQNQRYKTTSILIMAILLGYNVKEKDDLVMDILSFEDKKNILNNDRLLQRISNLKEVMFSCDDLQETNVNREIEFQIDSNNTCIFLVLIRNNEIIIRTLKEEKIFNIIGDKVYDEYIQYINSLSLFAPHMVSKGRDFVKYILVEETKKYWLSLDLMIKLLQNKLVKWSENSRKLTIRQINDRINALEFLKDVEIQIPNYLKMRKEYLEYIKIQNDLNINNNSINVNLITQYNDQLKIHFDKKNILTNNIQTTLNTLYDKLHKVYYGNFVDQLSEIDKVVDNKKISPSIDIDILDKIDESLIIRPIVVSFEENNKQVNNNIENIEKLNYVLAHIEIMQKDFYEAQCLYKLKKEELINSINKLDEINKSISNLNAKMSSYKEFISKSERFNLLKEQLNEYLSEFEFLEDFQIEMIESNILKAGNSNLSNIDQSIDYYRQMLSKENFNIEGLENFFSNLRDAYFFFGTEMSKLSKKEEKSTINQKFNTNILRDRLIEIFEQDIIDRCSFFLKTIDNKVRMFRIKKYSFWEQLFYSEDNEILDLQGGLSGGTDSVMTVYSMAASLNDSKFGNVIFVDEWGDVSQSFHEAAVKELSKLDNFAFAIFVDINDDYDKINISSELGRN